MVGELLLLIALLTLLNGFNNVYGINYGDNDIKSRLIKESGINSNFGDIDLDIDNYNYMKLSDFRRLLVDWESERYDICSTSCDNSCDNNGCDSSCDWGCTPEESSLIKKYGSSSRTDSELLSDPLADEVVVSSEWSDPSFCDTNYFASGFWLFDGNDIRDSNDQIGIKFMLLLCQHITNYDSYWLFTNKGKQWYDLLVDEGDARSHVSRFYKCDDYWGVTDYAPYGYLNGFDINFIELQNPVPGVDLQIPDQTFVNLINGLCYNGYDEWKSSINENVGSLDQTHNPNAHWLGDNKCSDGYLICGFEENITPYRDSRDDFGVTLIKFYCCPHTLSYPYTVEYSNPIGYWEVISTFTGDSYEYGWNEGMERYSENVYSESQSESIDTSIEASLSVEYGPVSGTVTAGLNTDITTEFSSVLTNSFLNSYETTHTETCENTNEIDGTQMKVYQWRYRIEQNTQTDLGDDIVYIGSKHTRCQTGIYGDNPLCLPNRCMDETCQLCRQQVVYNGYSPFFVVFDPQSTETFYSAQDKCLNYFGTSLAMINTQEEYDYIQKSFNLLVYDDEQGNDEYAWLNFKNENSELVCSVFDRYKHFDLDEDSLWTSTSCSGSTRLFICNTEDRENEIDNHINNILISTQEIQIGNYIGVYIKDTLTNREVTWTEANQYCYNKHGTYLATILSNNDNIDAANAVKDAVSQGGGDINIVKHAWIGLHDTLNENEWRWISNGQLLDNTPYKNWANNEPNNGNNHQDCGQFYNLQMLIINGMICSVMEQDKHLFVMLN